MIRLSSRHANLVIGVILASVTGANLAEAQGSRARPNPALRQLESKAQEAEKAYLMQLGDLASGYEDSGNLEQAEATLKQILRLAPDNDKVKAKLEELEGKVFEENQKVIEVDSSGGWVGTGLQVKKGEPVRIQADGTYKFIVNTSLGPDGFPTKDILRDMGKGINCGGLMGTVIGEAKQRGRPPQPSDPFFIGNEAEVKPDVDGVLFVRLNVPPGSKCIGKVKVMVSGNIAGVSGR